MKITEFIRENILILDGGMGTLLQGAGLVPGELPERWNITHPDVIVGVHESYFNAGANVVNTNTFGASSLKFSKDELDGIVRAAIENARLAAARSISTYPKWVALDIGPTGKMLRPYGDLDFEDAVKIFSEVITLGEKYGADLIFIETMNDSLETKAALLAAKESSSLPVFVSNAYGEDGKLMTGADPEAMIAMLEGMGADAIGVNCSLGPDALSGVVRKYLKYSSLPVIMKPNAGLPRSIDGKTVYDVCPADFSSSVALLVEEGVRAAGGCCGTTPEYIGALHRAVKDLTPKPIVEKDYTVVSSYTHAVFFEDSPILIGERINPTGKKRFKEALRAHDIGYILNEGISQQEAGAHILDVNVGLPEIDECELLTSAVTELQTVLDLPLQIDTMNTAAMESALRRYNGKAMINSVNGKMESMRTIFPLVKKYGGLVVALTLDEEGIPETAERRLEIARKILSVASEYGIRKKNLIFDPLTMTVSTDAGAARETLRAVSMIRDGLGCRTSLGVSNVSFGLPKRDLINKTFFLMALESGLSAAIMNPHSAEMMSAYYTYRALRGMDDSFADYIAFSESDNTEGDKSPTPTARKNVALTDAIVKGLKEQTIALTREKLDTLPPLTLINEEIIPALNIVGEGFEKGRVYLPGLLMSAEAAKCAFECVKEKMPRTESQNRTVIVMATVKGDIHDIGKNIVRLLLENYGFDVVDMGRDVLPERIADMVASLDAPILGLSALMTTTVPAMEETVKLVRARSPKCKIMVGGAVLNEEYAQMIGADAYAKDAMGAVRIAEEIAKNIGR